jgi:hypothetical protein
MGHRLEVVCEPSAASGFISIARSLGVEAKIVGRTETGPEGNRLLLTAEGQTLEYSLS